MDSQEKRRYTVVLAGNPNSGKSTLFNALTGMKQHTGNWAGKTVESARGIFETEDAEYELTDLPGIYSLSCQSAEEKAAKDYITSQSPDAAAVVCDSTAMERGLMLALEIKALGCPVVVCAALMDEAESRGITVNTEKLSAMLNVPVVPISVRKNVGITAFTSALHETVKEKCAIEPYNISQKEIAVRAEELCIQCTSVPPEADHRDRRIDNIILGKYTALPVMLLLLGVVLWITIAAASYPSQWLQQLFDFFGGKLNIIFEDAYPWLKGALIDGIYKVLTWVIAVMLPPMAGFKKNQTIKSTYLLLLL